MSKSFAYYDEFLKYSLTFSYFYFVVDLNFVHDAKPLFLRLNTDLRPSGRFIYICISLKTSRSLLLDSPRQCSWAKFCLSGTFAGHLALKPFALTFPETVNLLTFQIQKFKIYKIFAHMCILIKEMDTKNTIKIKIKFFTLMRLWPSTCNQTATPYKHLKKQNTSETQGC